MTKQTIGARPVLRKNRVTWLVRAVLGAWLLCALPASAQTLEDLRARGLVGEEPNGLLAIVDPTADAGVRAVVADINAKREVRYREMAASAGAPLDQVRSLVFEKVVGQLPKGAYYRSGTAWVRK